ncbi:MAG: lipid-A-disaccharide synthase [Rickettsiales bacterium]
MKKIFLIAGEASGDQLGAGLMAALKKQNPDIEIKGIGGERMQAEGLQTLFAIEDIALMGFAEILPHIPKVLKRIKQTVQAIEDYQPDAVVTIDSPGFNFRLVKTLRERGNGAPKFIHYVAPTVWAYKPERAKKTAALYDHLLVLLPFEPPYFEAEGLATSFVGHPVMDDLEEAFARRTSWEMDEKKPLKIATLPGSRKGELARMLPVYKATLARLKKRFSDIELIIATTQAMEETIRQAIASWNVTYRLVSDPLLKQRSYYACDVGLVKSGTVALEVAKTGLPMIVAYKVNPVSAWLLKRMIKTPFANLVNILAGREIIPELLQGQCTPKKLERALMTLIENEPARQKQANDAHEALERMRNPEGLPASQKAAEIVMELI